VRGLELLPERSFLPPIPNHRQFKEDTAVKQVRPSGEFHDSVENNGPLTAEDDFVGVRINCSGRKAAAFA
jgi:hypothetical protein